MCGVAGLYCLDPACTGEGHEALVRRMCDLQAHRGPDDHGVRALGPVCLGARRLSILDLSPAGHMPMSDPSGRWWIVYNGEVFNYRELRAELETRCHAFRSGTDTEVVLHAFMEWGERCVERFVGMFAFAVYDQATGRLVLGRDRFGIKPLYHTRANGHVLFASEIKALTAVAADAAVDHRRLLEWFLYRNVDAHAPRTLVEGVSAVMPGCVLDVGPARGRPTRVYDPLAHVSADEHARFSAAAPVAVVNEIDATLSEAIRLRLASDVPVGTLLSGGLDSSVVTAMAARDAQDLTAFNVSVAGAPHLDERQFAEGLARRLGLRFVTIEFTGEMFRRELVRAVYLSDLPLSHPNSVAYYCICRAARAHGVIVLLSGEGADELFGGYVWNYRRKWYLERLAPVLRRVPDRMWSLAALPLYASLGMPVTSRAFRDLLPATVDLIDRHERATWLATCTDAYSFVPRRADRAVLGALLADLNDFLSPLLRRLDRMSMGASVECRVPFLDHRLVHKAINLPLAYRIGARADKWVLRRLAERYVPLQFARRKKMGFPLPLDPFIAPLAHREFFAGGFCEGQLGLHPRALERLLASWHRWTLALFGLLTLEIWGRLFILGEAAESIEDRIAALERRQGGAR